MVIFLFNLCSNNLTNCVYIFKQIFSPLLMHFLCLGKSLTQFCFFSIIQSLPLSMEPENGRCSLSIWRGIHDLHSSSEVQSPQILNLKILVQKCRASRESILGHMVADVAAISSIPEQTFHSFITSSILAMVSRTKGKMI